MSNRRHPYRDAPARSFWSTFVEGGFSTDDLAPALPESLKASARVVSAGSCFAANLVPHVERHGLTYVRTEYAASIFRRIPEEALSYSKFSAGYGNVYTARQLLQLLQRSTGAWKPTEDRWVQPDGVIDPFRPGLRYFARNEREFDLLTAQHLAATRGAFEHADLFVFTLGLTQAWVSTLDGAVFPACPGTIAGEFSSERHKFVNFRVDDVRDDLIEAIGVLRELNPRIDVILTVSPVPLVATGDGGHVLTANTYSKSVLRAAAEEVAAGGERVWYFPAYEIVTGPQAPHDYFEPDRRSVSQKAIEAVMRAFFAGTGAVPHDAVSARAETAEAIEQLGRRIIELECEEAFADRDRRASRA